MTGTHSLFATDETEADVAVSPGDPGAAFQRVGLAVATALAGVAVLLDEIVVRAGRPSDHPTTATVSEWYDAHATRVLLGDALWLAACGVLVAALWTASSVFPGVPKWTARAVGLGATTVLAISSLFAAQTALGITHADLAGWHLEAWAFRVGAVLLALTMVPLVDGLRHTHRRWLVAPAALVALALLLPPTSGLGVAGAFVLFGVALGRSA